MTTPTLVCFDIGGVLIRHFREWPVACDAMGLPVPQNLNDPAFVAKRRELHQHFGTGRIEEESFYNGLAEAAGGGLYTVADIRRLHQGWLLEEYAGVADLLAVLKQRVTIALLSNTDAAHWRQMHHLPDSSRRYASMTHVHHPHASHLLGAMKPDDLIYERFEQAVGVAGERILFFDDLPRNIEAARARGWQTVHIDHTRETAPQIAAALVAHGLLDLVPSMP
ncbi:MAG: HAD-IA family hydrolase [Phycisphaerales bacterium]|jgi:putative hydrolase of the HAD superfamily